VTAVRWGILGPGRIARLFVPDVRLVAGHEVVAVGSSSAERASSFARELGIPRSYPSYQQLVDDAAVDVVYVATPHALHRRHCLQALGAGKAVLCEKPMTLSAAAAVELTNAAREHGRFLMEGMWTRCFPAMTTLERWIADDAIGRVNSLQASFGFRATAKPEDRLFARELGGGALLDLGVYAVSLASLLFGEPTESAAVAQIGPTGVDETTSLSLRFETGAIATLACSLTTELPDEAVVSGERGTIRIGRPFWRPHELTLERSTGGHRDTSLRSRLSARARALSQRTAARSALGARLTPALRRLGRRLLVARPASRVRFPARGHGFSHEIEEVGRCLEAGRLESAVMPLDETVAILRTLDRVRAQIGLTYPEE